LLESYPAIYPAHATLDSMHQALKRNPEIFEKVYEIRVQVENSPYQQLIDKHDDSQIETKI
jgi:hypothetical protein